VAVRLIDSLSTTAPLAALFSDESLLQAMLDFEAALARAEAREKIIPATAAKAIEKAANARLYDIGELAQKTQRGGTAGIPVSKALTEKVRKIDAAAAGFVHWGATSQDVADTGLILLLKGARRILGDDLSRLEKALQRLSNEHKDSVMLGRTLLQPAPPVTFGLKAAGWLGAVWRSHARLEAAFDEALMLQFGGASGTLAALSDKGIRVGRLMAEDLGLGFPDAPWHTQRDRLAALIAACGVLTGALGKMARDVSLLMQGEVNEAAEPGGDGRGGSSTMPQKRNPIGSALTLAAANRVPGLVAAFLAGMVQEHERGVGGWQAEWATVSDVVQATGLAASSMAEVAEGLSVNEADMRANIEATHGSVLAERAMMLLGAKLGRDAAHKLLQAAAQRSESEERSLAEVLAEIPEAKSALDAKTLRDLDRPESYLGVAEELRESLVNGSDGRVKNGRKK
jgi:3-carboxy-cis,cis-muconate cycloisomerase